MMRSSRKPPLPKSPAASRLLTPRRVLRSAQNTAPSPLLPDSVIKTQLGDRRLSAEENRIRPEYRTISYEIQALAKMVRDEFGKQDLGRSDSGIKHGSVSKAFFERGKFYEEYAAMRNERLKRKRGETEDDKDGKIASDRGVGVESAQRTVPKMRRGAKMKVVATPTRENSGREGAKRGVVSTPMTENRVGSSRYMLRSMNKENKKPPLPVKYEDSAVRKLVTRRARKI